VTTSLTTRATRRSSHLASMSSSAESPPPLRDFSGEPLLPEMPQLSSPRCCVALAIIPDHLTDGQHQNLVGHRCPCSRHRPSPVFTWAVPASDSLWVVHHRLSVGHTWHCASRPRRYGASGSRAETGSLTLFCFFQIFDLVQIIVKLKNAHD
jgi:hypothetical protein